MKKKKPKIRRSISLDEDIEKALKAKAEKDYLPVNTTLGLILRKFFKLDKR
jgi:hypothetical protein